MWELPTIRVKGTGYIIDLLGQQFRDVMNPSHRSDFDSVEGGELCRQAGVATCLSCGMSVIAAGLEGEDVQWCMRCQGRIER